MEQFERRQAAPQSPTPAAPVVAPATPGPNGALLDLQRRAGNRAVVAVLNRDATIRRAIKTKTIKHKTGKPSVRWYSDKDPESITFTSPEAAQAHEDALPADAAERHDAKMKEKVATRARKSGELDERVQASKKARDAKTHRASALAVPSAKGMAPGRKFYSKDHKRLDYGPAPSDALSADARAIHKELPKRPNVDDTRAHPADVLAATRGGLQTAEDDLHQAHPGAGRKPVGVSVNHRLADSSIRALVAQIVAGVQAGGWGGRRAAVDAWVASLCDPAAAARVGGFLDGAAGGLEPAQVDMIVDALSHGAKNLRRGDAHLNTVISGAFDGNRYPDTGRLTPFSTAIEAQTMALGTAGAVPPAMAQSAVTPATWKGSGGLPASSSMAQVPDPGGAPAGPGYREQVAPFATSDTAGLRGAPAAPSAASSAAASSTAAPAPWLPWTGGASAGSAATVPASMADPTADPTAAPFSMSDVADPSGGWVAGTEEAEQEARAGLLSAFPGYDRGHDDEESKEQVPPFMFPGADPVFDFGGDEEYLEHDEDELEEEQEREPGATYADMGDAGPAGDGAWFGPAGDEEDDGDAGFAAMEGDELDEDEADEYDAYEEQRQLGGDIGLGHEDDAGPAAAAAAAPAWDEDELEGVDSDEDMEVQQILQDQYGQHH